MMTQLLRGDRCHHQIYGAGTLWGWDTDYTGVHGASKYVTVRFDDGRVVIVLRADCTEAKP